MTDFGEENRKQLGRISIDDALRSIKRQRAELEASHAKAMAKLDRDERDLLGLR